MLVTYLVLLGACSRGPRNFENENDRLRAEVMRLESQVAELEKRAAAAEKGLEIEKQRQGSGAPALPEGVYRPVTSRIEITGPSRGVDTDGDGPDDAVRLYLSTFDQRHRFIQTLATVQVTVAAVPPGRPAVTVAVQEFDARAFDEAYRSGLGGTHYTLLVPITGSVPAGVSQLTVTVKLTDLVTGAEHETQKIVNFSTSR